MLFILYLLIRICVCEFHIYVGAQEGQKRMSDALELESQIVMSSPTWELI